LREDITGGKILTSAEEGDKDNHLYEKSDSRKNERKLNIY
jgi:hypothetical protein